MSANIEDSREDQSVLTTLREDIGYALIDVAEGGAYGLLVGALLVAIWFVVDTLVLSA